MGLTSTVAARSGRSALVGLFVLLESGCGFEVFEGLAADENAIAGEDGGSDGGASGERDGGICEGECVAADCRNQKLDGTESAVDCGGTCPRCDDGLACRTNADCKSQVCDGTGHCAPPSCGDDVRNGQETDTDCGGNDDSCARCEVDRACSVGDDCTEHVCSTATHQCLAARCDDETLNGDEKGADCGGSCAPDKRCAAGIACDESADCEAPYCLLEHCRTPHGAAAAALPGTLQAEDFDRGGPNTGYSDTTPLNEGSADDVRPDEGVDLEATSDSGGGYDVTKSAPGEWLAFTVDIEAESTEYTIELRAAVRDGEGSVSLELDGEAVAPGVVLPKTGATQVFTTVERNGMALPVGQHLLRVVHASTGVNLNWLRVSNPGSPYGGTPWKVPGKIEAEDFDVGGENVGYHAPGGEPTVIYRATGVRLGACSDTGGGFEVRDTQRNDWLMYSIYVDSTASYRLSARVANTFGDSKLSFEVDTEAVGGIVTVPVTPTFTDVSSSAFELTEGPHKLKLKFNDGFVSVNRVELAIDD